MKVTLSLFVTFLGLAGYVYVSAPNPPPTAEELAPGIARMEAHAGFYGVSSSFSREDEEVGRPIMLNDGTVYHAQTLIRSASIPGFAILCVSDDAKLQPIGLKYRNGHMQIAPTGQDYFETNNPCI